MTTQTDPPTRPRHPARVRAARRALFPAQTDVLLMALREVLCDPTRTRMVRALSTAELTVGDLSQVIGRSESATSQHLRVLRRLGVVRSRRRGRVVYNRLSEELAAGKAQQILEALADGVAPPS